MSESHQPGASPGRKARSQGTRRGLSALVVASLLLWAGVRFAQDQPVEDSPGQLDPTTALDQDHGSPAPLTRGGGRRAVGIEDVKDEDHAPPVVPDGRVRMLIRDTIGDAVPEAEVSSKEGAIWRFLGKTGSQGLLMIAVPGETRVCITHKDYAYKEALVMPGGHEVVVTMNEGGAIQGRIAGPTDPARSSIVVIQDFGEFPLDVYADARGEHPEFRKWPVSSEGEFLVTGLDPTQYWQVMAIGPEGTSSAKLVQPGLMSAPAWVELTVAPSWIAKFAFVGPNGSEINHSDSRRFRESRPAASLYLQKPAATTYSNGYGSWFLLPFDQRSLRVVDGMLQYSMLLTGPIQDSYRLPVPFSIQVPGYSRYEGAVTLQRPGPEAVAEVFELETEVAHWGKLDVQITGLEYLEGAPVADHQSSYYQVVLSNAERTLTHAFKAPLPSTIRIEAVPYGEYNVEFRITGGILTRPATPAIVTIGRDVATTAIDLVRMGSISFSWPDGLLPKSPSRLVLTLISHQDVKESDGTRSYKTKDFMAPGPPYIVRHLPAGLYRVKLLDPVVGFHRDSGATPPDTILVSESHLLKVTLNPEVTGRNSPLGPR